MKRNPKKASISQKIIYPILLMVLFQIFIFWLFIFQLGLFDSVVEQSESFYIQNSFINANQIDSEMWIHFTDLSGFNKSISELKNLYLLSKEYDSPLTIPTHIVTGLIQNSSSLHIDGIYLELFQSPEKRDTLHFRFDSDKAFPLATKINPDFSDAIIPLLNRFSYNSQEEIPEFRKFLNNIHLHSKSASSYDNVFELGSWSSILSMDHENKSLFYGIPLMYKNTQFGILAVEIFLSRFSDYMEVSSFPDEYPHQGLLLYYDRAHKTYDTVFHLAYNMEALPAPETKKIIEQAVQNLSDTETVPFISRQNNRKYFCVNQVLPYSSAELSSFSTVSFYYLTLSDYDVVFHDSILLKRTFIFLVILFILISIIISLFITKQVVSPIAVLTSAIKKTDFSQSDPLLPQTEITEVDILIDTISSQNKNLEDFHQMITTTLIASEINVVTFYTNKITKITRGFGNFQALLGDPFSENYILKLSNQEFAELEKRIYRNFTLYSSSHNSQSKEALQTDIYFDNVSKKYICVKSREMGHGRTRVFLDYTSYVLEQEKIKQERDHDVLTSLLNRFSFTKKSIDYLETHPGSPIGMVMWDLDYLKHVNDTFGHDMGDSYLRKAGDILSRLNPEKSYVARVSGDEFFAFLFDYEDKDRMIKEIEATHKALNEAFIYLNDGSKYPLSASCGYTYSFGGVYEELKKKSDLAMYASKKSSKGSIHEYKKLLV